MLNYGYKGGSMRAFSGASLVLAAMLTVSSAACAQLGQVQAMRSFKTANQAYQAQDYRTASTLYEDALAKDPNLVQAHFFLGNSYDNMYRSTRRGEPDNDALLEKAVQHYELAADRMLESEDPDTRKLGILALQYLSAVFGPDKLADPASAEPVIQRLIRIEPGEVSNYIVLARLYEDAAEYEEAERILQWARQVQPDDPNVYMQLASFYNRQGEFEQTIEALELRAAREPDNPEAFFTIATYYWDNASRNFRLLEDEKMENVKRGLDAVDKALAIRPDYMEALVYKGLLLRVQANLESDYPTQQALIKQADALRDQAEEIRKKRATGA
jgi:tetratricopeptide (TPR) repeat protein